MLSSRDVENCEDTPAIMEEKGETKKRGRTYRVAGVPNDVRYKNNTLTPGISMRYLPKYVPVEGFEHIPLVKSEEYDQYIQLKKWLL